MTPRTDPLAELDSVAWSELTHAYGPADDVPGQLRALRSPERDERAKALHELYGNVFHQGSRYEASAYAVPFLVGMAVDPATPDRAAILELVGALAIGYDESHLPAGVDAAAWRSELEEFRAQDPAEVLARYDTWVAEAPTEGDRRVREMRRALFDFDRDVASAGAELAVYDAVRGELPRLGALLDDTDPEVRAITAYVLAWFPEESGGTVPRLVRLLDGEANASVAASAIVALGLLGDPSLSARLARYLTDRDRVLRWAAATALARLGGAGTGPDAVTEVVTELALAGAEPPEPCPPGIPFHEGDLRGYAAASLTQLAGGVPDTSLDAVVDGIARTSGPAAFAVTHAALSLAFGPERPEALPAFADLRPVQQRLVRVLAGLDQATWRWGNFLGIVRAWGLPAERAALRAYAGLPSD
ncbi:HEAT repeat domain-containing protein [Streptomyces sp. NPDC001070]